MIKKIYKMDIDKLNKSDIETHFFGNGLIELEKIFIIEGEVEIFALEPKKVCAILFADRLDGEALSKVKLPFTFNRTEKDITIIRKSFQYVTDYTEIKKHDFITSNGKVNTMIMLPIGCSGEEVKNTMVYLQFVTELKTMCNLTGKLVTQ